MNTVESLRATIYFGLAYIALVAAGALWSNNTYALWLIIATAGAAYLTQALNTTWCVLVDNGRPVEQTARYHAAAIVAWCVSVVLGVCAFALLVLSSRSAT